jgi:hypothetical protein
MHTPKAIPAAIFALSISMTAPLLAQQPLVGSSCTLMHFGERGGVLHDALQTLLRKDELAEMRINFHSIQPTSEQYAQYVNEYGLAQDSAWALRVPIAGTYRYRFAHQGKRLPTVEDIQNALEQAGIKSPIKLLRDFLKLHPDHLDARAQLLQMLREPAEARTRQALQLGATDIPKQTARAQASGGTNFTFYNSVAVDTTALDGKTLKPEQDAEIWGQYAQELQTLFASGDWRLIGLNEISQRIQFQRQVPLDVCSPTMVQLYRRHLGRVEAFIEEFPASPHAWLLYGWMASITKHNSVRALYDRLVPPPEGAIWPTEEILSLLIPEQEAKGNWGYIAETLWPGWPKTRLSIRNRTTDYNFPNMPQSDNEMRRQGFKEARWNYGVRPLLESLIRTNRTSDAETVILGIAKYSHYRDFQGRAAALALSCGRQDLQAKWAALQIPEESVKGPDLDFLAISEAPIFVSINGDKPYVSQINDILAQDQIMAWHLSHESFRGQTNPFMSQDQMIAMGYPEELISFVDPKAAEMLQQREGWPMGEAHWALFYKGRVFAHGPGLPTQEALVLELESSRMPTRANALRRFIADHPAHFEAREMLLRELKRLAEHKTRKILGEGAGTDPALMLSDEDDYAIWNEFASLHRQLFSIFMEQGVHVRGDGLGVNTRTFDSPLFMHSQRMKDVAHSIMPQVADCLKRQPSNEFLWGAWSLAVLDKNSYFRDFKNTLTLSPMDDPTRIPPLISILVIMGKCRTMSNWQMAIDVGEWHWETMRGYLDENPGYMGAYWMQLDVLLEAYLRLDKYDDANALVRTASQSPVWLNIKEQAVGMAKECGKDNLAEQWGKL